MKIDADVSIDAGSDMNSPDLLTLNADADIDVDIVSHINLGIDRDTD